MKYIKNIMFDIYNGILRHPLLILCPTVITSIAITDCLKRVEGFTNSERYADVNVTFGDVWFYLYGGMEKYIQKPDNPFQFPVIWTVLMIICAILVLTYPTKDMLGIGAQVIVAGGSRGRWWFSKVIWNILATLLYHATVFMVIIFVCMWKGIEISPEINMQLQFSIHDITNVPEFYERTAIPLEIFALPVLVSVSMNLLQMTFTLFMNPNYTLIGNCALMIAAAYMLYPMWLYNYAMALRYRFFYKTGIQHQYGFLIILLAGVVSVMIGYIRFKKYDILKKEDN